MEGMFSWSFEEVAASVRDGLGGLYDAVRRQSDETALSVLLAPVDPYNRASWLTPLVQGAGVVSLLVLAGLAVGGFAVAIAALLAILYLLAEVFGYNLELAPFATAS